MSWRCIDCGNIRTKSRVLENIIKEKIQNGSSDDENLTLVHILHRHTSKIFGIIVYVMLKKNCHALPSDVFAHLVYEQLLF